ncbi:hypothetical protein PMAYCL1PPCAC_04965 [Pristionchus mayeri]|uniref:Uncharacterized protein n=1 Tax=Pristionchus mayeri TaxID=1317129 RepID=A0AAN4ZD40_9BILA|nr:hypothetical protein PMAYCL1PPCAC_04965 [Pristionchus mayeri]
MADSDERLGFLILPAHSDHEQRRIRSVPPRERVDSPLGECTNASAARSNPSLSAWSMGVSIEDGDRPESINQLLSGRERDRLPLVPEREWI